MSQASNQIVKSFICGADSLATKQYHAVQMGASDNAVIVAGAGAAEGAHVLGVLQNKPAVGEAAAVAIGGTSKLQMGATCDRGEKIKAIAGGTGTPATADQESVIGIALESATSATSIIEILLTPGGHAQANESD